MKNKTTNVFYFFYKLKMYDRFSFCFFFLDGRKNRQLSKKLLTAFIKMYKDNPCLWKIGDPSYNSKKKKDQALDDLIELIKEECPEANRNFVKKKLNALRGTARMEHKKYLTINKSKPDCVYKPSLWYYDLIKFVFDSPIKNNVDNFRDNSESEILPNLQVSHYFNSKFTHFHFNFMLSSFQ